MSYLYWHLAAGVIAAWMLVRFVPMANLVGVIALIACVLLGPFALATAAACALVSMNADQSRKHIDHGHDAEFYKHKHDRRHK